MNVGFDISTSFGKGGIQTYLWELLEHMVPLSDRPALTLLTRTRRMNVALERLGGHPGWQQIGGMPHPLMLGRRLRWVTELYKDRIWRSQRGTLDLVHFHEVGVARSITTPYVVTVHDLFPMQEEIPVPANMRAKWTQQAERVIPAAQRVIVPSEYVRTTIAERFPSVTERIRVTPLAASDRFSQSTLGRPLAHPYVLWIGRIDPRKNLTRILEAWRGLPAAIRSSHRCVLIGPWDPAQVAREHPDLAALLSLEGLEFRQHVSEEEHRQWLTHADALVFPSLAEGFGLPIVEAMRCGCPVLTSSVTSMPEVAGDAAILVDPTSVDEIREGLERLCMDAELRTRLKERGQQQAERFSWERTARQTVDVYNEVLA